MFFGLSVGFMVGVVGVAVVVVVVSGVDVVVVVICAVTRLIAPLSLA